MFRASVLSRAVFVRSGCVPGHGFGQMRGVLGDDVAHWSTARQAAAIRSGEFSARDLWWLSASRIERLNPAVNAIVTLDLDRAARDASFLASRGSESVASRSPRSRTPGGR